VGTVVEVDSTGLNEVNSFVVRSKSEQYRIFIGGVVNLGFPPGHLNEHRATGQPVRVEVDRRDGKLFAVSIRDA
jgi:hypothetical protein